MTKHLLLMYAVCKAAPQEYGGFSTSLGVPHRHCPRPPTGLPAFDITQWHSLATDTARQLAPFTISFSQQGTAIANYHYARSREHFVLFARQTGHQALPEQM